MDTEVTSLMSTQSPVKVYSHTKDRIRYLAALSEVTQAEIIERAVSEYAVRHADEIAKGLERARKVLAGGDTAIAAELLGVSVDAIERISGGPS